MSPLTHFTIYPAILRLNLSITEKLLLCLVLTFNAKGVKMSNLEIGKALNVSQHTIKNALASLRRRDLIETTNSKSKYRKIRTNKENLLALLGSQVEASYLPDSSQVETLYLPDSGRLLDFPGSQHKERSIRERALFDRFWSAYPKKVSEEAARKAFAKRKPDEALLQKMLQAIEQQKQTRQWQDDDGRYIPNPTRWLNEARWEDEGVGQGKPAPKPLERGPDGLTPLQKFYEEKAGARQ
jgi:hypothetical protein